MRGEEEREGGTPIREEQRREEEGERRGERGKEERTPRPTRRRRRRDRTDDSLWYMVVTLPTFHEDRSWLKAEA